MKLDENQYCDLIYRLSEGDQIEGELEGDAFKFSMKTDRGAMDVFDGIEKSENSDIIYDMINCEIIDDQGFYSEMIFVEQPPEGQNGWIIYGKYSRLIETRRGIFGKFDGCIQQTKHSTHKPTKEKLKSKYHQETAQAMMIELIEAGRSLAYHIKNAGNSQIESTEEYMDLTKNILRTLSIRGK